MSDLKDPKLSMLRPADNKTLFPSVSSMLIPGETIVSTYKAPGPGYGAVFTNKRIIMITPQPLTSLQTAFTSLHYSKIQTYIGLPANGRSLNNDLKIWISGFGEIELSFSARTDVFEACKIISMNIP